MENIKVTLLIGASSAIAKSVRDNLLANGELVIAVSRTIADISHPNLEWLISDYSEKSISSICTNIANSMRPLCRVGIFLGLLHNDDFMPEKKLEDWNFEQSRKIFHVNVEIPLMWLSNLAPILSKPWQRAEPKVSIATLTARVGSIGDNNIGGWYSYRASKSALNMALKTASIELARRAPNAKLISFHPGTTDTQLSKPFQARVPANKLFTPDFVAKRLLNVMDTSTVDGTLSYLDWDNKTIPW
jgi:NAD(P)-dependent dehydrogenase (short-subunit alcohol dehydrogenase family)|tara:strand:- start:214 stop:948 length:735 start_codon:yes stop_codon:yes gene_type:complete